MNRPEFINGLIAEAEAGVTLADAAAAAFQLSRQTGLQVRVLHNNRLYDVTLMYTEVKPNA